MASDGITRYINTFLDESKDLIDNLVDDLLLLENAETTGGEELINTLFRAFHTIKSNAHSLGFKQVAAMAHTSETFLDRLRSGQASIDRGVVDALLRSVDDISGHLEVIRKSGVKTDLPETEDGTHDEPVASVKNRVTVSTEDAGEKKLDPRILRSGMQLRILVAEGGFMERLSLQRGLSELGMCYFAINGQETIRAVSAGMTRGRRFDLLVLDLSLSRRNGFEVIRTIRNEERQMGIAEGDSLIIVALSPFDESEALQESVLESGANLCLMKSILDRGFLAHVREFFS